MILEIILQAIWVIIPAYTANGTAILIGGDLPIDFGKNWKDGKRIFGDGKTWRGLLVGTFVGMTVGFGLSVAAKYINASSYNYFNLNDFYGFPIMIPIIFSISFGALFGDTVKSFFKRRIGKERGEDWIPFDQLDFLLGALLLSFITSSVLQVTGITNTNWFFDSLSFWHVLSLAILTPLFHVLGNFIHRKLKSS